VDVTRPIKHIDIARIWSQKREVELKTNRKDEIKSEVNEQNPPIWLFSVVGVAFALVFAYLAITTYSTAINGAIAYGIMAVAALVVTYSFIRELQKPSQY